MEYGTIYIIKNTKNKKVYIGQTKSSLKERYGHHLSAAKSCEKSNLKLYEAMKEIGKDNFYCEALETNVPEHLLIEKEEYYIDKYNSFYNGYNGTKGGKGGIMLNHSEMDDILELAKDGVNSKKIAETYGVHHATVLRHLHNNGFKYRTEIAKEDLQEMVNEGLSNKEISEILNCDMGSVHRILHRNGIRKHRVPIKNRGQEFVKSVIKDYESGKNIKEILEEYDLSKTAFHRMKKKYYDNLTNMETLE